jgi:hypothetical protein
MLRHIFAAGFVSALLSLGAAGPAAAQATSTQAPAATDLEVSGEVIQADSDLIPAAPAPAPAQQPPQHRSPEIIRTENFTLTLGARLQLRYTYDNPH